MGKERAEIDRTVLAQPARDVHARIFFKGRETNIGIGLIVPQQDIEFRLIALDEIIFERQSLAFVIDDDVIEVGDLAHQGTGFGVHPSRFEKVGTHPRAQGAGLADVQNGAEGILE